MRPRTRIFSCTAARILTRWPQLQVAAALLVAPADPSLSRRLAAFAPVPARPLGVPATLVASRNEPWMRFNHSADLAAAWGADLIDLGHAGHINVASGFGPWPRGMALRDAFLAAKPGPIRLPIRHAQHQRAIA